LESADAAIRRHEVETRLRPEQMADAHLSAKMGEAGAAAHADVLTGINELAARGILKRAGPAAKPIARF
jgi:hypothetical protein